jgi:hypothetical protein
MKNDVISPADIEKAHQLFEENEPRDLFYKAASELMELAINGKTKITVSEAIGVLLQTWNKAYYQYHRFDNAHIKKIDDLINRNIGKVMKYRNRSINSFSIEDRASISKIFNEFELILGPVGAAKSMHLLAPKFFPLWDRTIAINYDIKLLKVGNNSNNYLELISSIKQQIINTEKIYKFDRNPIKSIDEVNYCKYTKDWL